MRQMSILFGFVSLKWGLIASQGEGMEIELLADDVLSNGLNHQGNIPSSLMVALLLGSKQQVLLTSPKHYCEW